MKNTIENFAAVQHTPTPWHVAQIDSRVIVCTVADDGEPLATVCTIGAAFGEFAQQRKTANAAHIVKCVNEHDELVAALRLILEASTVKVCNGTRTLPPLQGIGADVSKVAQAIDKARALLEKIGA